MERGRDIDTVTGGETPAKRRRGRPRDPGADRRILTAAREVAADVGVHGASMSAIAARSGVGKPTIYLRWANRRDLMVAAVADLRAPVATDHTGSTRDDLLRALLDDRAVLVDGEWSRFLRAVLFEVDGDPELARELEAGVLAPRRGRLVEILARGVEEGRIRGEVDLAGLADLLSGPLMRAMVLGGPGAVTPESLESHVDVILGGVGTAEGAPEAGRA